MSILSIKQQESDDDETFKKSTSMNNDDGNLENDAVKKYFERAFEDDQVYEIQAETVEVDTRQEPLYQLQKLGKIIESTIGTQQSQYLVWLI